MSDIAMPPILEAALADAPDLRSYIEDQWAAQHRLRDVLGEPNQARLIEAIERIKAERARSCFPA